MRNWVEVGPSNLSGRSGGRSRFLVWFGRSRKMDQWGMCLFLSEGGSLSLLHREWCIMVSWPIGRDWFKKKAQFGFVQYVKVLFFSWRWEEGRVHEGTMGCRHQWWRSSMASSPPALPYMVKPPAIPALLVAPPVWPVLFGALRTGPKVWRTR